MGKPVIFALEAKADVQFLVWPVGVATKVSQSPLTFMSMFFAHSWRLLSEPPAGKFKRTLQL